MSDDKERWYVERKQEDGSWKIWQHPNHKVPTRFSSFGGAVYMAGRKNIKAGKARVGRDQEEPS